MQKDKNIRVHLIKLSDMRAEPIECDLILIRPLGKPSNLTILTLTYSRSNIIYKTVLRYFVILFSYCESFIILLSSNIDIEQLNVSK